GEVRQTEEEMVVGTEARTFRLTSAPLRGPDGPPTHTIVLIEDITMQKRLERQMILTERLSTAGRLAAGVAHELNNPLATIAGCAEALKERAQAPDLAGLDAFKDFPPYLGLIEEEAYRCKEITGSLLQFVREPGSRRAPTDVNVLVEKSLELLSHQPRFAGSGLETDLDPTLPRAGLGPRPAVGGGQRGPAAAGVPGPGRQRARGDGWPRPPHRQEPAARRARGGDRLHRRGTGHRRRNPAPRLRSLLHHQAPRP